MASDEAQLSSIIQRLQRFGELLNPVELATTIGAVISEIAVPPPGDPAALRSLADAHRTASSAIEPLAADVGTLGTQALPEAWEGGAAQDAAAVIEAVRQAVDQTPEVFTRAAETLDTLAGEIEAQQDRHDELHQQLSEAWDDAKALDLPGPVDIPNPWKLDELARAVSDLIGGCIQVYTDALDSANEAQRQFGDLAGHARAAAAVEAGLAPDDAVVLAAQGNVEGVSGFDDGILTPAQLRAAGGALDDLSAADREAFGELLNQAGSDTERAWLMKALAAGNGVGDLEPFAESIRGKSDAWLDEHLSVIDRGTAGDHERGGSPVKQLEDTTCGTTTLIVARAENDPLYALSLTEGDFEQNFADEQARVHDETNKIWPEAFGTSPEGMADYMSNNAGTNYDWHLADDTNQRDISEAMRDAVTAVDEGHPVPLMVGGEGYLDKGIPRHYVMVVGHSGGDMLIYDPADGETTRVSEADFVNGNLGDAGGNWDHVKGVVSPS